MDLNSITVESVFEESVCATCGRFGVDKYSSIIDCFIKYKNQLVSFVSIIQYVLDWTPSDSMQICEHCKVKLQEFYNFKTRSENARKIQQEFSQESMLQKLTELDKEIEDPVVFSTLQIVRDYVNKHSVQSIDVEESTKRLIITSAIPEEVLESFIEVAVEPSEVEEDLSQINPIEDDCTLDDITEYVEDYIEEEISEEEAPQDSEMMSYDEDTISDGTQEDIQLSNSKRPRNPEQWACNQRKKLRNSGQSYINSKGRRVGARQMRPNCGSTCRIHCEGRISEAEREINFQHYWSLGDVVEQRKFIHDHIISKEPTRRKNPNSSRTLTLEFYLDGTKNGAPDLVHVCKKMFKNTLAVSSQVIQGVVRKYAQTGFIDSRGKHVRKLTEAQEIARQHVQKFPYFYIDQNMTKIQLYNMYCEECKNRGIEPVKESNYRDIFDRYHSNNFLKSDKILCEKCHKYFKSSEEQRILLQKEHDEHLATDRRCRDRALGRIRHKRSLERKRAEKLASA